MPDTPIETSPPFMRYLNTILLTLMIGSGGWFCSFVATRLIEQGEKLSSIQASQVTRAEMEAKLASIQNEQLSLRAKITEMEIKLAGYRQ